MFANPFVLLPLLGAAAGAGLAALTWGRRLGLVALAATLWNLAVAFLSCTTDAEAAIWIARAGLAAVALGGPTAFAFLAGVGRFSPRGATLAVGWAVAVPVAVAALVDGEVVAGVRAPSWGGLYPVAGSHGLAPAAVAGALTLAAWIGLVPLWWRTPPSRRRRQLGWVLAAFAAGLGGAFDVLGFLGSDVPPVFWATSLGAFAILYHAIVRDRLLDVPRDLERMHARLVFAALTFGPVAAAALALGDRLGFGARLGLLALLVLVARRVERLLAWLFGRRRRRLARAVQRFARATRAATCRADVHHPLGRALAEGFGLELVAVEDRPPVAVTAEALARAELDPDEPAAQELHRWLDDRRADVVVPMPDGGAILARAALPSRILDRAERQGLRRLAARAQVACANGALHEELEADSASLATDVAERTGALERALVEAQAAQVRVIQADRQSALGLLVAGASHEVNNALNFIYGNAPILEKYVASYAELAAIEPEADPAAAAARARLAEAATRIAAAAGRARVLLEDLRRFARPDDRTEPRRVDVADGLRATCALLAPELRGRAEIVLELAPGCLIAGFPSALNQVFLNVLVNAAQALRGGRGTIAVDCAASADGVDIQITDDGVGVAPAAAPRLFEPFFTTKPRAAGLGLTVARDIVARHGGTIAIAPVESGGARVAIRLPRDGV
jgi:signal transduction histidine kinase